MELGTLFAIDLRFPDHLDNVDNLVFYLVNSFDVIQSLGYVLGCFDFEFQLVSERILRVEVTYKVVGCVQQHTQNDGPSDEAVHQV